MGRTHSISIAALGRTRAVSIAAALGLGIGLLAAAPSRAANIFENVPIYLPVLNLDASLRAIAMGGASTAVAWGDAPDHWANPALLGYARGIRYEQTDMRPYKASILDARYETRRTTIGVGGVGLALAGQPLEGLGESKLDFGTLSFETPPDPPITFHPIQRVRSWGIGASAAGVVDALAGARGRAVSGVTRYLDVAVGYSHKHAEQSLGDSQIAPTLTTWDLGSLARATVPPRAIGWDRAGRLEASYGFAVLNGGDETPLNNPPVRHHRNGFALRAALDAPAGREERLLGWLTPGPAPDISLGASFDTDHITAGSLRRGDYRVTGWGVEATLASVVSARYGRSHDFGAGESRHAWGLGIELPLARYGGVHYDRAWLSRSEVHDASSPDSWSFWIDPLSIYRAVR